MDKIYLPEKLFDLKFFTKNIFIIEFWLIISIFLDQYKLSWIPVPFEFYTYYVVYILYLVFGKPSKGAKTLIPALNFYSGGVLLLALISLVPIIQENLPIGGTIKQMTGLLFSGVVFAKFLNNNSNYILKIFELYVRGAVWLALLAILQEISFITGNGIGIGLYFANGFYRIWGTMGEPYFLASILIPALYYTCFKLIQEFKTHNLLSAVTLLLGTIFTFSTTAFTILPLIPILLLISFPKKRFQLISIGLVAFFLLSGTNTITLDLSSIEEKLFDTLDAVDRDNKGNSNEIQRHEIINTSSFAWYSNFTIAKRVLKDHPITGGGLGQHAQYYDRYFADYFPNYFFDIYGALNKQDANSLFIRLLSETGYLGLGLFIAFIVFNGSLLRKSSNNFELTINQINNAILIMILIRFIRTGHYFSLAFPLFIFLYYTTAKRLKNNFNRDSSES